MERLLEGAKVVNHIVPLERSPATVNGTGVDTKGYAAVSAIVACGAIDSTNSDTTLNVKLQESDVVDSGFVDVTGAAIVALAHTDDNAIPTIDVNLGLRSNRKRYIRAVAVVGGTDDATYGVLLLLYKSELAPVVNSPVTVIV